MIIANIPIQSLESDTVHLAASSVLHLRHQDFVETGVLQLIPYRCQSFPIISHETHKLFESRSLSVFELRHFPPEPSTEEWTEATFAFVHVPLEDLLLLRLLLRLHNQPIPRCTIQASGHAVVKADIRFQHCRSCLTVRINLVLHLAAQVLEERNIRDHFNLTSLHLGDWPAVIGQDNAHYRLCIWCWHLHLLSERLALWRFLILVRL